MRGHADAATLAAFREELLSARKAAQVSAHLAACPRCAALEAQLADVTTLLNRATAPPMPDALTARIQAALAAEAAARTTDAAPRAAAARAAVPAMAGTAGQDGTQGTNGRDRPVDTARRGKGRRERDRSWLALRVAAVTAAAAAIAGGGYGVAQLLTTGSHSTHGASTAAGAGPNIRVTGPTRRASGLSQAPAAASGTGNSGTGKAGASPPLVVTSGTNYRPTSLGTQARAALAQRSHSAYPAPSYQALSPNLQACLIHVGKGQRALLVDESRYQGHPALVVVLAGANGARPQALVIAPGCNATTAHVLATAPLPPSG